LEQHKALRFFQGKVSQGAGGFYCPINLIDKPWDDAPFVSEEVFGPIRSILKYTAVEDAIRRANKKRYGLGASVWGEDLATPYQVAQQLKAGAA